MPTATVGVAGGLEPSVREEGLSLYDEMNRRGLGLDALADVLMLEAVRRHDGNLAAAARALGITRPQLSYRLSRLREGAPS